MEEKTTLELLKMMDGKLDGINDKLDNKVSNRLFYWVMGFVVLALIGLGGESSRQNTALSVVNTKLDSHMVYSNQILNESQNHILQSLPCDERK